MMGKNCTDILYTGAFRFPDKDAAGSRVLLVGECLKENGYTVTYLSWDQGDASELKEFNGFSYRNLSEFRVGKKPILSKLFDYLFMGRKTIKWILSNRSILHSVKVIFLYNPPTFFSLAMCVLARFYGLTIVLDSTEWYESSHLPGGKYGFVAVDNYIRMRFIYPRFDNFIAISHYLERYYGSKKKNVLCLPALFDSSVAAIDTKTNHDDEISIIYAGNAGKKDLLQDVIKALPSINSISVRRVSLSVYGLSESELRKIVSSDVFLAASKFIVVHGKVSKKEVSSAYSYASFSVLFREDKRYALAGFPTKAVESWALGVPVITNAVGDLKIYCNERNSIVVNSSDFASCFLNFLSSYDSKAAKIMREVCFKTAHTFFSVESNSFKVGLFMKKLIR